MFKKWDLDVTERRITKRTFSVIRNSIETSFIISVASSSLHLALCNRQLAQFAFEFIQTLQETLLACIVNLQSTLHFIMLGNIKRPRH